MRKSASVRNDDRQLPLFDLAGRRVLVIGLGESGLAMARWCAFRGASVVVADTRAASPAGAPKQQALREAIGDVEVLGGEFDAVWLEHADLIACSPGLSVERGPLVELLQQASQRGIPVVGELGLFAQAVNELRGNGYSTRIIAITGTNGKTTTTALTARLCAEAGLSVRAAGNIRPAMLDALREALGSGELPEVWVLELSSFQLALSDGFIADVATILNLAEDHLDWHASMESYLSAKRRIHSPSTIAVVNREDPATQVAQRRSVSFGAGAPSVAGDFGIVRDGSLDWLVQAVDADDSPPRRRATPVAVTLRRLMPADALQIRGQHNRLNALASLALCSAAGLPMARLLHGLRAYAGEPHRCQLIALIDGVEYYDDSKGTNVGATVAALEGLGRPCHLIAGGEGKGQDFSPLAPAVARHASAVFLIGRDAPRLRQALAPTGVALSDCPDLPSAVRLAAQGAVAGEAVLLSPACASFDMFRDYAHRAEVFCEAVRELQEGCVPQGQMTC
jgi:UDP-N-acetylmuramoylalanine--D-glutamate ligase